MPSLYIVATPIGNLEDITLRALRVLKQVAIIAAEDTRTTRKLLTRYRIKTPTLSFNDHNQHGRIPQLLDALREGDVALVSDAGVPTLSDPGRELVRRAADAGISTVPIPGPSALTTAISASGLPANSVLFLGFLPRQKGERLKLLESLAHSPHTTVIYESPRRVRRTLEDLLAAWGDRTLAVARELTKIHEEVFRGSTSRALVHFTQTRGEFTLVVEGGKPREVVVDEAYVSQELARLKNEGLRAKEAVGQVAGALALPRRQVYQQWLALSKKPPSGKPTKSADPM